MSRTTQASPEIEALALSLAGDHEGALGWLAAVLEADPSAPDALLLAGRALAALGKVDAAEDALSAAAVRATDAGRFPLAVAACRALADLGHGADDAYDAVAAAFEKGSPRIAGAPVPPRLPAVGVQAPVAGTGAERVAAAVAAVASAERALLADVAAREAPPAIAAHPLFSSLERSALRALVPLFDVTAFDAGQVVIEQGAPGAEAYVVVRGDLEVRRTAPGADPLVLAELRAGALFGEMALLSRAPRAASVVARAPSLVLVASKQQLDHVAESEPSVAEVLAMYCRRRMVHNLVRTSAIFGAIETVDRKTLVERFETRVFEPGDKLIEQGEAARGLHLVASGEVSVVRREGDDALVLARLGAGEVVGEVSLVLRRPATADVVAAHPTVTLHLSGERFLGVVREHPTLLAKLYELAVARDDETRSVVAQEAVSADDFVLV